jgi:mycothiol synthase
MPEPLTIRTAAELTADEARAVREIAVDALAADGQPGLNDAATFRLNRAEPGTKHVLGYLGERLAGYAQLEPGQPPSGQIVVAPADRGHGLGRALLDQLLFLDQAIHLWAPGDSAAAQALAAEAGLHRVRELLIMERELHGDLPEPAQPPGIEIRTFRPGEDEAAWLAVNATAFADHPEQGRMTADDLATRMAEPWFDPAGFFVAYEGEAMVGFHWTKQHPNRVGEVYVLAVHPAYGGRQIGKALLATGLRHLERRDNTLVRLYVEGDHPWAVALYRAYGFATVNRDVMYARG